MWHYGPMMAALSGKCVTVPPAPPSLKQLERLADKVINGVRRGGRVDPGDYVHQQVVANLGGTQAWEALITPLRQLPPFVWPS
jgi:hypothetical protein